jgi:signal transduction histidine kinase
VTTGEADGSVIADPTRLRQVLLILLDNALRYTPAGGSIRLSTRAHGSRVQISVADTGSGIASEHLPHVFERFYRADGTRGEADNASGLGLSIAKGLVEAQHGRMHMESQPGRGTQVLVSLPAEVGSR